jgi:hypothetical protein
MRWPIVASNESKSNCRYEPAAETQSTSAGADDPLVRWRLRTPSPRKRQAARLWGIGLEEHRGLGHGRRSNRLNQLERIFGRLLCTN